MQDMKNNYNVHRNLYKETIVGRRNMWDFLNKKCFQLGVCSRFTMYDYGLTLAIIGKNSLLGVTH